MDAGIISRRKLSLTISASSMPGPFENEALLALVSPLPEHMSEEELVGFFSFVVGLEIISFASYQATDC
jgi:hypothetical protein